MAATLSFLKLPVLLPHKPNYCISKLQVHPSSSKPNNPKQDPTSPPQKLITTTLHSLKSASLPLTALTLPFFLDPKDAFAVGGEFGILEGRTFALIHPVVMGGLFVYTLWAGMRLMSSRSKRSLPLSHQMGLQLKHHRLLFPFKLSNSVRKELVKGGYRDRHFNAGSLLLAFGVFEAIGGGVNTWLRTGKLFPGPHLFAGAGITVLWAAAAALVPAMQKGNETARSLHIALNAINLLLFIWQIPTGLDIVWKVFEFTKWP
ncbi:hypothetical protein ACLB2K_074403 [Fragaria x ananassa]